MDKIVGWNQQITNANKVRSRWINTGSAAMNGKCSNEYIVSHGGNSRSSMTFIGCSKPVWEDLFL